MTRLDDEAWHRYLTRYHNESPAITERLLGRADCSPYRWLTEPLREFPGPVLDLGCGSAPTRDLLPDARWVGADRSASELAHAAVAGRGPLVRARAEALPVRDNAVAAVCAAMSLQAMVPFGAVLAELKRVLEPGGRVIALVPARLGLAPLRLLAWGRVVRAVRTLPAWPNPRAADGLARLLHYHGFAIRSTDRRVFRLRLAGPEDAALLVDGLYLPGTDSQRLADAKRRLACWTRNGRTVSLPLRRVVAELRQAGPRGPGVSA